MKKKFICLVLLFCMVMPCMFALSGCVASPTYVYVENVAQINEALANDLNNDIIQLQNDIDLKTDNNNQALVIDSGNHIIDLNGYTLTGVDNGSNSYHAINLKGNNTVLTIIDSSTTKTGTIEGRCYGIQVSRGATLFINGGNYVCTTNKTFDEAIVVYGGTLVVNNGNFTTTNDVIYASPFKWDNLVYNNRITINGGTFTSTNEESSNNPPEALFMFEQGSYGESSNQVVVFNGGTFNKTDLAYVVKYDETTTLTNRANIATSDILCPAE